MADVPATEEVFGGPKSVMPSSQLRAGEDYSKLARAGKARGPGRLARVPGVHFVSGSGKIVKRLPGKSDAFFFFNKSAVITTHV